MNRRDFVNRSTRATFGFGLGGRLLCGSRSDAAVFSKETAPSGNSPGAADSVLDGTAPLTSNGDLAVQMVEGIRQFLLKETVREAAKRGERWKRVHASVELYEKSVAANRQRFREIIESCGRSSRSANSRAVSERRHAGANCARHKLQRIRGALAGVWACDGGLRWPRCRRVVAQA